MIDSTKWNWYCLSRNKRSGQTNFSQRKSSSHNKIFFSFLRFGNSITYQQQLSIFEYMNISLNLIFRNCTSDIRSLTIYIGIAYWNRIRSHSDLWVHLSASTTSLIISSFLFYHLYLISSHLISLIFSLFLFELWKFHKIRTEIYVSNSTNWYLKPTKCFDMCVYSWNDQFSA
jgi:hypothetical protein